MTVSSEIVSLVCFAFFITVVFARYLLQLKNIDLTYNKNMRKIAEDSREKLMEIKDKYVLELKSILESKNNLIEKLAKSHEELHHENNQLKAIIINQGLKMPVAKKADPLN
jgi:signal transduction histidine kinase